jgi:subtilisin family serine protease
VGFCLLAGLLHAQDSVTLKIGNTDVTFQADPAIKVIRVVRAAVGELANKAKFTGRFQTFATANLDTGELAVSRAAPAGGAQPASPTTWEKNNQAQNVLTAKIGDGRDVVALCQEMIVQFTDAADDTQARRLLKIFGAYSAAATPIPGRYLVTMPNTDAMVNAVENMKQNATIPSKDKTGRIKVVEYATPNLYYIRPSMVATVKPSAAPLHPPHGAHGPTAAAPGIHTPALGPAAGIDWQNTITDEYFGDQWPFASLMTNPSTELGILRAWSTFGFQGGGVKVAVIDDGVDLNHEDIKDAIADFWDTTTAAPANGAHQPAYSLQDAAVHGTLCAGLVAAQINGKGIVGVSPGAKIFAIKAASYGTSNKIQAWINNPAALADAIDRAHTMGADIISASWGMPLESPDIRAAISRVGNGDHRTVFVFAAGNLQKADKNQTYAMDYPARLTGDTSLALKNGAIISVGASTPCDSVKSYKSCDNETDWASKYSQSVTVVAPGTTMPSTLPSNQYSSEFRGTSAATPIVAGVVALLLSKEPNLGAQDVFQRITALSKKITLDNQDFRRIDAFCILENSASGCQ